MMWKKLGLILVLAAAVSAQPENRTRREYSGYPASNYETYDQGGGGHLDKLPLFPTGLSLGNCGHGLFLKAAAAALAAVALVKLPILFALKLLVLKLAVPFAFLTSFIPVALPLIYYIMTNKNDDDEKDPATTMKPSDNEMRSLNDPLITFLGSQQCLEKIACELGGSHAPSKHAKSISWVLSQAEKFFGFGEDARANIVSYRAAYKEGISGKGSTCHKYFCPPPRLLVGEETFRVV